MGGCRCSFRDCPVGTSQNPRMHFFHFPISNRERYLRWLQLADRMNFLEMPKSFQNNRVVCARHFRVECFTNYKRDRLIVNDTVEPTLMPLNEDTALDYAYEEENGGPEMVKITTSTKKHLIPPTNYEFPFTLHDNLVPVEYVRSREIILSNINSFEIPNPRPPPLNSYGKRNCKTILNTCAETNSVKKFKILNSAANTDSSMTCEATNSSEKVLKIDMGDGCETLIDIELADLINESAADSDDDLHKQQCKDIPQRFEYEEETNSKQIVEMSALIKKLEEELNSCKNKLKLKTNDLLETEIILKKLNIEYIDLAKRYEELEKNHKKVVEASKESSTEMQRLQEENNSFREKDATEKPTKYQLLQEENKHLRDICAKYKNEQEQKQKEAVITSQATSSNTTEFDTANRRQSTTATNSMQNSLTKGQLFNGVKKYISSTMVALLRMEMFGDTEREWKPDERRVSMDLLALGDGVYKYVSDEWRFRLPALCEVRRWIVDAMNSLDDEEDL